MARFGFCSASYRSQSLNADAQKLQNWYLESDESGSGASAFVLYQREGLNLLETLPDSPGRCIFSFAGRCFAVAGSTFYEILANGAFVVRGQVANDGKPATMAANATQLLIVSGGSAYFLQITASAGNPQGPPWAPNTPYAVGTVISALATDGNTYNFIVVTGGTSGASAPAWPAAGAVNAASPAWQPNTAYQSGQQVSATVNGVLYNFAISIPGTSGAAAPAWNTTASVTDGTATWVSAGVAALGTVAWSNNGVPVAAIPANTFRQLDTTSGNLIQGAVSMCAGSDGYLTVLLANSQKIQISAFEDATTWSLQGVPQVDQVSEYADQVLSLLCDHRQLWLFGVKATLPYYDSGSANTYDPVPGGYIEQGIIAPFSAVKMNNSVYWLGGSDRGAIIAWNAQGYQPVRVSNHAVEFEWSTYSTVTDAVAFAYEISGHTFWVIRFPTAGKTWVYDAATGLWHERSTWNPAQGVEVPWLAGFHTYVFGMHLTLDWSSGNVYQAALPAPTPSGGWSFVTDNGAQINRIRRAPHITTEKQWAFHQQLQVNIEAGVGPQPPLVDGQNNPRAPQLMLRWSDDGGHQWSQYLPAGFGMAGETYTRCLWRRLGKSRDRIYEVSCSDPVPARLIDAYLIANPGFGAQDSLYTQIRKVT